MIVTRSSSGYAATAEQFLAKNLHLTRERTGVLIFVSLGERMAELIADEGIADHVDQHVWDKAMAALTEGMKRGDPEAGFAAAVGLCGDVLAEMVGRPGRGPPARGPPGMDGGARGILAGDGEPAAFHEQRARLEDSLP